MKRLKNPIASIALAASLMGFADVQACGDPNQYKTYAVEKDSLGRLIVLWTENRAERPLNVSIDGSPAMVISLPGQNCLRPKLHVTPQGHIVALWTSLDKNLTRIHAAMLPYEGKWTQPICLAEEEEIVPNTLQVLAALDNEISVSWETMTYYPAVQNPGCLAFRKELRYISGSLKHFDGTPKTLAILQQSENP